MQKISLKRIVTDAQGKFSGIRALVFGCLLFGWGVLLVFHVLAWRHVQTPFPGFIVEPSGVLTPFGRPSWERFQVDPPIAEPEKLVSVDGIEVENNRVFVDLLREHYQAGDEAFFTFVKPDGSERTVLLMLQPWPVEDFVDIFVLPYLVGIALLALGTWVFISQRGRTGYVFAATTIALALGLGLIFDVAIAGYFPRIWIAALAMIGPLMVHLSLFFPYPVRFTKRVPWVQYVPYAFGAALVLWGQLTLYHWPSSWAFIPAWRVIYLAIGLGMLAFLGMLVFRLLRPYSATVRQQSRIILMGATLAFAPILFWFFSNILGYPRPFSGIYAPFAFFFPLAMAYAVLRYRLANIDAIFARGVTYALMAALGLLGYLGLQYLLVQVLGLFAAADDIFFVVIFVALLIFSFDPLRGLLQQAVDRFFRRTPVDYRLALQSFRHTLTETLDLPQVLEEIVGQLAPLNVQWAILWFYDDDQQRYLPHMIIDGDEKKVTWRKDDAPVLRITGQNAAFILDPDRFPEDQLLKDLGGELCVPIWLKQALLGWILLGARSTELLYSADDLEFLSALAEQSALALENAELFNRVTRNLDEIQGMKKLMDNVFASVPSGVITMDLRGRLTLCTPAAERILGVSSANVLGKQYVGALDFMRTNIEEALPDVFKHKQSVSQDASLILPDQRMVYAQLLFSPLYAADGAMCGVIISVDDLTRERELQDQAQKIQKTFERYFSPNVVRRLLENPDAVHLGGTAQEVTVMFADLREFETYAAGALPEYLVERLNLYLSLVADGVMRERGLLDKFYGTGAVALFNAPQRQPDHILRAARAALRIQKNVLSYHELVQPVPALYFGVGIHVGVAVVGNIGAPRMQSYTAIGECVNVASQLQVLAQPGQVLISEPVYAHLAERVEAVYLEEFTFAGQTHPMKVYELKEIISEDA